MTEQPQHINFSLNRAENYNSRKSSHTPKKTQKDFQKILGREQKDEEDQSEKRELSQKAKTDNASSYEDAELKLEAYEEKPKSQKMSLFEIASSEFKEIKPEGAQSSTEMGSAPVDEHGETVADFPNEMKEMSLSALFKGYGTKEKLRFIQEEVKPLSINEEKPGFIPQNGAFASSPAQKAYQTASDDLRKPISRPPSFLTQKEGFPQEQIDIASITPSALASAQPVSGEARTEGAAPSQIRIQELQKMIDQIVQHLAMITASGKTDTLITLQHPPLFAGSSVVISSFESARGEFNITFENLTQAAKQMIDMQENQNSLKLALEQRGYIVHIITATTLSETTQIAEGRSSGNQSGEEKNKDSKHHKQDQNEE